MVDLESDVRWRLGGLVDRQILTEQGIKSNTGYRQYLITNADNLIGLNQSCACNEVSPICAWQDNSHIVPEDLPPYLYQSPLETARPTGYETSNMKEKYLSEYRAKAAKARIRVDVESVDMLKDFFIIQN